MRLVSYYFETVSDYIYFLTFFQGSKILGRQVFAKIIKLLFGLVFSIKKEQFYKFRIY